MARKKYADWDAGCQAAYEQLNEMIESFGYSPEDLNKIRTELERYMPPEVLFDKMSGDRGNNLMFALFATEALKVYCSTRDSNISRRLLFERDQEPIDFVMSVMTGYRKSGVMENGILDLINQSSLSRYDPEGPSKKNTTCPHCEVSFWTHSADNGNPQYKNVDGWRETEEEAPEHIVVDKSSGARAQGQNGYHFCGGKHQIYLLNPDGPTVNIELAERLGGASYEELSEAGRIRVVQRNGRSEYFLVDEYLPQVEEILQGKKSLNTANRSLKNFDENWIDEEGNGIFYRQCRFPIELLSPVQVAKKRVQFYQPYVSIQEGVDVIDIYKCPNCNSSYRDREGITSKKLEDNLRVEVLRCKNCGEEFDINDPKVKHHRGKDVKFSDSLDSTMAGEEDGGESEFTRLDVMEGKEGDDPAVQVEFAEFERLLHDEVIRIAQGLNIRGSENAWEIFEDIVEGKRLKDITEKYFSAYYQLHYSYCADCHYTMAEKPNPTGEDAQTYDQGLPVNLQRCPRRHESPQHQVNLDSDNDSIDQQQDQEADLFDDDLDITDRERELEKVQLQDQLSEKEIANKISDSYERQKYLGLNIVYVGKAPDDRKEDLATCYQVMGWDPKGDVYVPTMSHALPSGTYNGTARVTRHIYAPAERLLRKLREGLMQSPIVREHEHAQWLFEKVQEGIEEAEELREAEASMSKRKIRKFCKAK